MEPPSSSASASASVPSLEQGKLFVGGIPSDTREELLSEHFGKYGEVREVVVMRDRITGNGRGFGFVQFVVPEAAESALKEEKHVIRGRTVEVKRAIPRGDQNQNHQSSRQSRWSSRSNGNNNNGIDCKPKKIFVGGLPDTVTQDDFKNYFEKFGTVIDTVVMYDNMTHKPRGFGFITFDSEDAVETVMQNNYHELNGKRVEVKIAVPKDGTNPSSNSNHIINNNNSRVVGRRGPACKGYRGGFYAQSSPQYGYFLLPSYSSNFYGGYTMSGYMGVGYGYPFASPRSPWSGQGLVASSQGLYTYDNAAIYPGYLNGGFGSNMGVVAPGYTQGTGFWNNEGNHSWSDVQALTVGGAASSQVEGVSLDAQ